MARRDADLERLLRELRLSRMADILKERLRLCRHESWSYQRLLQELLEEEIAHRRQSALERRIQQAKLPEGWCLETFPFHLPERVNDFETPRSRI